MRGFSAPGFDDHRARRRAPPLIRSKLEPPAVPASVVSRPRLLERLSDGDWRVAVVTGGAGTGKTLTVRHWLDTETPGPWAWVSLDSGDSHPERFWSYVLAALDRAAPGCFVETAEWMLESGPHDPGFVPTLLNEAAAMT